MTTQSLVSANAAVTTQKEAKAAYFQEINFRSALCNHTVRSNCIGTALFLTGETRSDRYVDTDGVNHLKALRRVDGPVLGGLIAWQRHKERIVITYHMGVVTSLDPLLITQRNGSDGNFEINNPFKVVDEAYLRHYIPVECFVPKSLEKLGEVEVAHVPEFKLRNEAANVGNKRGLLQRIKDAIVEYFVG